MDKVLYPTHPVRCINAESIDCGNSAFLTNLILNINNEFEKNHIYSSNLHQELYQKLFKCFSKYIAIHIFPNISIEEVIDVVIDDIVDDKNIEKTPTEIET